MLSDDGPLSHASTLSYVETLKRRVHDLEQQSPPGKRPRLGPGSLQPLEAPAASSGRPGSGGVTASTAAASTASTATAGPSDTASAVRPTRPASTGHVTPSPGPRRYLPVSRARSADGSASDSGVAAGATSVSTTSSSASTAAAPPDGSIRAMMGEIGQLTRNAMGEPHDGEQALAQRPLRLALDRLVLAALAMDGHDPSRSVGGGGSYHSSLGTSHGQGHGHNHGSTHAAGCHPPDPDEPPIVLTRSASVAHLHRFLDEVAVRFPHMATAAAIERLEAKYEAVVEDKPLGKDKSSASVSARFAVYLAIATGALLAPEAGRLHSFAQRLHAAAVRLLPAVLRSGAGCTGTTGTSGSGAGGPGPLGGTRASPGPPPPDALEAGLTSVRALLSLTIYAIFSPHGGSAWHLLGMATQRCIALGLRREADSQLAPAEADERRRLFWSVYILDRSLGLVMDRPFSIQDEDIFVNMPDDAASPASLSHYLVVQARLVSDIRTAARPGPLFDYSNFCYWRDFPPVFDHLSPDARDGHADYLYLLSCRTLIQIMANDSGQPSLAESADSQDQTDAAQGSPAGLLSGHSLRRSIEDDTAEHCRGLIERAYARADRELFVGSFVDALDLFAAAVVYLCLRRHAPPCSAHTHHLETSDLLNKCTMLITSISERFTALKPLRRVLVGLVRRLRVQQLAPGSPLPLEPFPAIVPAYIRRMAQKWL